MRNATIEKYKACIEDLAGRKRGISSAAKVFKKHRVSMGTGKILQKESLLAKRNGIWKWVGSRITNDNELTSMAQNILHKVNCDAMGIKSSNFKRENSSSNVPIDKKSSMPPIKIDINALEKEKLHLHDRISKIDEIIDTAKQLKELLK